MKAINRMAFMLFVLLAICGSGRATCSDAITSITDNTVLSGSAVVSNSQVVNGGGLGPWSTGIYGAELNYDYLIAAGNQTLITKVNSLSGGTTPQGGFLSWLYIGGNYVALYIVYQNGQYLATFEKRTVSPQNVVTNTIIGQQAIAIGAFLKLVKTASGGNANYSGYVSTDGGVNYQSLGTANGIFTDYANTWYGLYADSGDTTNLAHATFNSVGGLNLAGLTDSDINTSFLQYAAGSAAPQMNGGSLYIGQDSISGHVFASGCGVNVFLTPYNNLFLKDSAGNTIFTSSAIQGPQVPNCNSGCNFSTTNPLVSGQYGPFTLVHGQTYTFISKTTATVSGTGGAAQADSSKTFTLNP